MKTLLKLSIVPAIVTAIAGYGWWYLTVPAINIFDYGFILLLFIIAFVFICSLSLAYALVEDEDTAKNIFGWSTTGLVLAGIVIALILPVFGSPLMRAKGYSNIVSVKTKDFKKDFPESKVDQLYLAKRQLKISVTVTSEQLIRSHSLMYLTNTVKSQLTNNPIVFHHWNMQV